MEKAPSHPTMRSQVTSLGTLSCLKNKPSKEKKFSGENDEVPLLGMKSSDLIVESLLTFTYLI